MAILSAVGGSWHACPVTTTPELLADYLRRNPPPAYGPTADLTSWHGAERYGIPSIGHQFLQPPPTRDERVRAVADHYLADAEFRSLQLADWLQTPDGQLFERAVALAMPSPFSVDLAIVVDGLKLAARLQQEGDQRQARRIALGVVLAGAAVLLLALASGER